MLTFCFYRLQHTHAHTHEGRVLEKFELNYDTKYCKKLKVSRRLRSMPAIPSLGA